MHHHVAKKIQLDTSYETPIGLSGTNTIFCQHMSISYAPVKNYTESNKWYFAIMDVNKISVLKGHAFNYKLLDCRGHTTGS